MRAMGSQMIPKKYGVWLLFLLVFGCTRRPPATSTVIYDEKADAHHDIAAAIANAEESQRNIVLIFGANW